MGTNFEDNKCGEHNSLLCNFSVDKQEHKNFSSGLKALQDTFCTHFLHTCCSGRIMPHCHVSQCYHNLHTLNSYNEVTFCLQLLLCYDYFFYVQSRSILGIKHDRTRNQSVVA